MAVTRSRLSHKKKSTVKRERLKVQHDSVPIPEVKKEPVELPILRSTDLAKQEQLKQKEQTIMLLTKMKPSFKRVSSGGDRFMINKRAVLNPLIDFNITNRNITEELTKGCQASYKSPMINSIVDHKKRFSVFNFKQQISSVAQSDLVEDDYSKLPSEKQKLSKIFKNLYQYNPTAKELISDINKLPNFNKKTTSKRRKLKSNLKNQITIVKPQDNKLRTNNNSQNDKNQYPLTISNLYKNFTMSQVTTLKQNQLLQTCEALNLRLKNIDFERRKFDLNDMEIVEEDIYPMDDIYLRSDEDSDDEEALSSRLSKGPHDFGFILEGLNELDYIGERSFEEKDGLIKL